jgi:hypothetical protein
VTVDCSSERPVWLVIGLVVFGLILAIAIPNIKLGRMTANEAAARQSLRAINLAEAKFAKSDTAGGYACSLQRLSESHLIEDSLANGKNRGFLFDISDCGSKPPYKTYHAFATPLMKNQTGYWVFCSDQTGQVKGSPTSRGDCSAELMGQR